MSIRSIVRELKEMRDGIGSMSRRGFEGKSIYHGRARSRSVFELHQLQGSSSEQGDWANLPQELLVDVIRRIEASETSWPARKHFVACAAVCRSWREVTKEIVKTPEQCGRLTFPISLKQPGPRDSPIQCFIRRERETSMFYLYLGLSPGENGKLLLSARKIRRRPAPPDFLISLDANDFSRTSNCYVGKLSSGLFGNKFTVYDSQPQNDGMVMPFIRSIKRLHSKKISPKLPAGNFNAATIAYEFNVLGTRGPRRMRCTMNSIPISCIQDGGEAPTPTGCPSYIDESFSMMLPAAKFMDPIVDFSSTSLCVPPVSSLGREEPLTLKNKAPRWHEQLQCWCLNFRGRVTVASVKNFQLVAEVEPSHQVSAAEQDKVILQFGKIGRDIFTMDYQYPLSAFQAFAICLSSFDTKFACE